MSERFADKTVIVTGAASGIGAATAKQFAAEGARVIVSDLSADAIAKTVDEIVAAGGTASGFVADVTDESQVEGLIAESIRVYGALHVLHCNAGRVGVGLLEDVTHEQMQQIFAVNVFGVMDCIKYALPHLEAVGGNVVITASKVGLVAQPATPVYNGSKGAVIALTKSLAIDYAKRGVRVNAICPGIIDTPLFRQHINGLEDPEAELLEHSLAQPIGRLGTPEECAGAAVFLASDDARFITGETILIDGGFAAQ